MRLAVCAPVLVALLSLAAACGDDGTATTGTTSGGDGGSSGDGGSDQGGSGPTTTSTGGTTTTGVTTGSTSTGTSTSTGDGGGTTTGQGGEGGDGTTTGEGGDGTTTGQGGDGGGTTTGQGGEGGGGSNCTVITAEDFALYQAQEGYASYLAAVLPNLGGAETDAALLEFYGTDATGSFDLSAGVDANYATCEHCLRVFDDTRVFFQESGTLTVDAGSDQLAGVIDATLTDVRLVEVTIAADFTSTPVPGGACLEIESATVSFDINVPADGWTCDDTFWADGTCDCGCGVVDAYDCEDVTSAACDVCNSVAGGGCNEVPGDVCPGTIDPANNALCVDVQPPQCMQVTADDLLDWAGGDGVSQAAWESVLDQDIETVGTDDVFSVQLYTAAEGTFSLTAGANANYSTCNQCVLVYSDDFAGPIFYQSSGSITVAPATNIPTDVLAASVTDMRLVEVTIAPQTFVSTPVPNGACLDVVGFSFTGN